MSWTMARIDLEDGQVRTRNTKLNEFTVRGDYFSHKSIKQSTGTILIVTVFSFCFSTSSSWEVSYIIQLPHDHFDPTLIDHLSLYLSTCPIRHPLQLFVNYGCQGSTIQGFSPHKCGQKSSCSTFNAMVAAFHQIFLSSHHHCTLMMHVSVTRASWNVTLIIRIHIGVVLNLSKEVLLLEPSSTHSLFTRLQTGIIHNYLFLLRPFVFSDQAQGPIYTLGP